MSILKEVIYVNAPITEDMVEGFLDLRLKLTEFYNDIGRRVYFIQNNKHLSTDFFVDELDAFSVTFIEMDYNNTTLDTELVSLPRYIFSNPDWEEVYRKAIQRKKNAIAEIEAARQSLSVTMDTRTLDKPK